MRNDESGCTICVWEVPPDCLHAFGVRRQAVPFSNRQLSRADQIHAKLEPIVIECFSRRRSSRCEHFREKQFPAGVDVNPSRLHIARSSMRNENLRKDIQSRIALDNERLCDLCLADGISCTENAGGAWARQHGTRALTNSDIHLDMITRKKTRRRIDHVDDQMISIPIRLA